MRLIVFIDPKAFVLNAHQKKEHAMTVEIKRQEEATNQETPNEPELTEFELKMIAGGPRTSGGVGGC